MDECLLNDLLECSVCLERLDTSSRVLPCQHTFCLKCLKVIVESHKELRCPECRVLVEVKVEELPPNVLLMRILEGMKNAPRKPVAGQRARTGHAQAQQTPSRDIKHLPPHARALHDYSSKEMGDLTFKKGETILLHKKLDAYWYQGECSGRAGMFPITYVQVVIPLQVPTALCKALYDFRMSAPDEEGCLAFDKGAIITVHRRVDENWAEGRLEQRVGIFPIAFVELNQAARMLMNKTLNRPVPPIPDHSKAGHSDHRHHATQHLQRYQPMSTSMPTTQSNYQNMPTMSLSHPNYQPMDQILPVTQVTSQGGITTSIAPATMLQRNIVETKHSVDLIHFAMGKTAVQFVPRLSETFERSRGVKWEYNPTTPVHKVETTYQNVRSEPVNFTNSSDSSSSVNTPSAGSTTTPNTSSNTSTCESAEPSLPSSPDNNTERNATVVNSHTTQNPTEEPNEDVNTSMGVLSLNESSTATNTSLNVSLPPAESPKLNAVAASGVAQNQEEVAESTSNIEPSRLELPSSSKGRSSGPDSLLNFGLGLQAVLSPSHDALYLPRHREPREKRHSLTPSTHVQNHTSQNRHSAEILATSLLDQGMESGLRSAAGRRRRERSAERGSSSAPHIYVALYPYKPQKSDELELKKGGTYMVSERCRDGWFKGWCARSQRHGVFPGNYVTPRATQAGPRTNRDKTVAVSSPVAKPCQAPSAQPPPDAPPRGQSPVNTNAGPLHNMWTSPAQSLSQQSTPRIDKSKDKSKAEKSSISTGVSLMKRLAAMKKCKSPPPQGYSMDNPVFEDGPGTSLMLNLAHHPVHVRSNDNPWQSQHRKSQSLDVTAARRDRHHSQTVKERFRCIVPYPPNSEYELELKVDDVVIVHKKRGDGWYKGTLQRTGRTGLFPASFVQSAPQD